jgi:anti-sigma regulatory factor (Ser/Thr protein kinase)
MAEAGNSIPFHETFHIDGGDFVNAGSISSQVKKILIRAGFSHRVIRKASVATFEAEMNVICYADRGNLSLFIMPDALKIVVEDEGVGIPDVNLAMREGYSTANEKIHELGFGAGMGLSNIKNNTDGMILTSKIGQGTHLEFVISLEGKDKERVTPLLDSGG